MTRLPWAIVALVPLTAVLTVALGGCAAEPAPPDATPSLSVSPPTPPDALPSDKDELAAWAAVALPEDRPGSAGWVAQGAAPVGPDGATIDAATAPGRYQVVLACQSADGSPVTLAVEAAASGRPEPVEVACGTPGGTAAPPGTLVYDSGDGTTLRVTAATDAVYAYAIRPYSEPGS